MESRFELVDDLSDGVDYLRGVVVTGRQAYLALGALSGVVAVTWAQDGGNDYVVEPFCCLLRKVIVVGAFGDEARSQQIAV